MNGRFHAALRIALIMVLTVSGACRPSQGPAVPPTSASQAADAATSPAPASAPASVRGFRGDGSGRFPAAAIVTEWSQTPEKNLRWKAPVGESFSSPVVAGGRIFVASDDDRLVAVDRASGQVLWNKANPLTDIPEGQRPTDRVEFPTSCGQSAPTPVTDGRHVWAVFHSGVAVCYDLDGRRVWIRHVGLPPGNEYGMSASPVLVDGKLILIREVPLALDAATGKTAWVAEKASGGTYGTPVAFRIGDTPVVLTPAGECLAAADGRLLSAGWARVPYSSPIVHEGVAYFFGPPMVAVRIPPTLEGDAPKVRELWSNDEAEGEVFASPLYHDGVIYGVTNTGSLVAVDARTGELLYKEHVDIPSAGGEPGAEPANLYASLTLAGDVLVVCNDTGSCQLFAPGRTARKLGIASVEEGAAGTPLPDGDLLLLRGGKYLYAIGKK